MVQLIDKSAVVAEIEARINDIKISMEAGLTKKRNGEPKILLFASILSLLDTLEVKEVDLCKEEERIWKDFNMGECHLSKNDLEKISKHFFELGMAVSNKAQKGEEI